MHIPDGYLSPQTYGPLFGVAALTWCRASAVLQRTLHARQVPLLAFTAGFTFVIMLFNVPIPGGSTGHATGAVLVAVLLGPWAAVLAVSVALALQAFLFGDGGITTLGATCVNVAFVLPMVGYGVFRLIAGEAATGRRRWLGAGVGGYVGLNVAALLVAVELGLQPLIASDPEGRALYAPFPLHLTLPALALPHLLFFGPVEAVVTALVVRYADRYAFSWSRPQVGIEETRP